MKTISGSSPTRVLVTQWREHSDLVTNKRLLCDCNEKKAKSQLKGKILVFPQ